jgi:hypothetical protein
MNKIRFILTFLFIYFCTNIYCQSFGPTEINVASYETKNSDYYLSYTIGGNVITNDNRNNYYINMGIQENPVSINSLKDYYKYKLIVNTFPNPASEVINIGLQNSNSSLLCLVTFTNVNGCEINQTNEISFTSNNAYVPLNINNLSKGIYIVSLISKNDKQKIASFKLVKI